MHNHSWNSTQGSRRAGAAVLALLGAQGVHAQTPVADAAADSGTLQEIVVTAEKRSESLQSVPVSVTVLTSSQLGELKLDSPSAIATQIPNLQVGGVNGEGSPIFSLRGVSMFDYSLNQSSPVASYVDEVYKGNVVLFGVEFTISSESRCYAVRKAPCTARISTGGAINFITKKPGFDTEGDIQVGRRQLRTQGG